MLPQQRWGMNCINVDRLIRIKKGALVQIYEAVNPISVLETIMIFILYLLFFFCYFKLFCFNLDY